MVVRELLASKERLVLIRGGRASLKIMSIGLRSATVNCSIVQT